MPKETTKTTENNETKKPYDPYKDKVTINITPPSEEEIGKHTYISVNNYNAKVQYGVDVSVPRFVREALITRKIAFNDKMKYEKKRREQAERLEKMLQIS